MIHTVSPYTHLKILLLGLFFGFLLAKWKYRRMKTKQFVNLRFGDLGENKRIKL